MFMSRIDIDGTDEHIKFKTIGGTSVSPGPDYAIRLGQSRIDQCRNRPGEEQKRSQLFSPVTTLRSPCHIGSGCLLRERV